MTLVRGGWAIRENGKFPGGQKSTIVKTIPGENANDERPIRAIERFKIVTQNIVLDKAVESIHRRFSKNADADFALLDPKSSGIREKLKGEITLRKYLGRFKENFGRLLFRIMITMTKSTTIMTMTIITTMIMILMIKKKFHFAKFIEIV